MTYNLWRTEKSNKAPHAAQAFVFDGWSHEPLVIAHKQDPGAAPQRAGTHVVEFRPTASKAK